MFLLFDGKRQTKADICLLILMTHICTPCINKKGGTFKDYKDKTYLKLDDYQLSKHLSGEKFIGIYQLLKDNNLKKKY